MNDENQFNQEFETKKPKKKGAIIGVTVVLIAIIAVILSYYFLVYSKPKYVFEKAIDNIINNIFEMSETHDSIKKEMNFKVSIDAKDETYKEVFNEIQKLMIKVKTQLDAKEKREIVDLGLQYDNESVIDLQVYYDNGKTYGYLDGIYDKYINLESDEETNEMFNNLIKETEPGESKSKNKVRNIIKKELKAQINEKGKFEKKETTITINGKQQKVNSSILTLDLQQVKEIFIDTASNLLENDKFMECFEESPRDILEEGIVELEKIDFEDIEGILEISIYNRGLLNDFAGMNIKFIVSENNQNMSFNFLERDKETYEFGINVKADFANMDVLYGTIEHRKEKDTNKEKKGTTIFNMNILNQAEIRLEGQYSVQYDSGIDEINVKDSVMIDEITDEEVMEMYEKIVNRPLIGNLVTQIEQSIINANLQEEENSIITEYNNTNIGTNSNQLKNGKYIVEFSVPNGLLYENNYSSDSYKYYSNDEMNATIKISWQTEQDYRQYVSKSADSAKEYFDGTELSPIRTITVGNKIFKYQILTYRSYNTEYQEVYLWSELNNEYMFIVELDKKMNGDTITENTIKEFLNISVSETN